MNSDYFLTNGIFLTMYKIDILINVRPYNCKHIIVVRFNFVL